MPTKTKQAKKVTKKEATIVQPTDLAPVKKQVSVVRLQAANILITNSDTQSQAVDFLDKIKGVAREVESRKTAITKPLNEALKAARALFKPMEEELESAEAVIKSKLSAYQFALEEQRRQAEEKIRAREEAGRLKAVTADRKIAELVPVENKVRAESGRAVTFRTDREPVVQDASLVPDDYWVLDMVKVRRDALAGVEIPGVVIEEKKTPVFR